MIIGITGTYCAGKNYVAALLEIRGLPVLDVDKLGYKALETEKEAIIARFGDDLRKTCGSWQPEAALDRRLLGQIVFGNPEKLAALEAIVHPAANRLTDEWIAAQGKHCVINAALLHRANIFNRLDRIIMVTAPYLTRLLRARRRDRLSWQEIIRRFASQHSFNSQYLTINANPVSAEIYIVKNPGITSSQKLRQKLERRVDKAIEGII
jgi:dephospho-CoA kinase